MSRYARRVDTTHAPIRDALERIGATVLDLSRLGHDAPDLAIGYGGRTLLVEAKSDRKVHRKRGDGRSPGQVLFAELWRGDRIITVTDPLEAVRLVQSIVYPRSSSTHG